MPAAAEEAGEEVEGVVVGLAAAALLVGFEAVMAIAVVDLSGFGLGEGFVGFGDAYKFLLCRLISTMICQCCVFVCRM